MADLAAMGCKIYVCPNISEIDRAGKRLNLSDKEINDIRKLAVYFFKKTYKNPNWSATIPILKACMYLLLFQKLTQWEVNYGFLSEKKEKKLLLLKAEEYYRTWPDHIFWATVCNQPLRKHYIKILDLLEIEFKIEFITSDDQIMDKINFIEANL